MFVILSSPSRGTSSRLTKTLEANIKRRGFTTILRCKNILLALNRLRASFEIYNEGEVIEISYDYYFGRRKLYVIIPNSSYYKNYSEYVR